MEEGVGDIVDLLYLGIDFDFTFLVVKVEWEIYGGYIVLFFYVMYKIICICKFFLELN